MDAAVSLLDGHKVYQARNISDAQRKLVEEGIELAVIGPGLRTRSRCERGEPAARHPAVAAHRSGRRRIDHRRSSSCHPGRLQGRRRCPAEPGEDRLDVRSTSIEGRGMVGAADFKPKTKIGKVITIMSPKGGAGKTMTSSNVGLALAMMSGTPERGRDHGRRPPVRRHLHLAPGRTAAHDRRRGTGHRQAR